MVQTERKSGSSKTKSKTMKRSNSSHKVLKEFVHRMLEAENTIRMFHWKTHSYSVHKKTDKLHETLSGLVDRYVETFMGKKNIRVSMKNIKPIKIQNLENSNALEKYIEKIVQYVNKLHNKMRDTGNNDLYAIRDEIISELNRSLYLFRFNKK